jgi:hypothetical protein
MEVLNMSKNNILDIKELIASNFDFPDIHIDAMADYCNSIPINTQDEFYSIIKNTTVIIGYLNVYNKLRRVAECHVGSGPFLFGHWEKSCSAITYIKGLYKRKLIDIDLMSWMLSLIAFEKPECGFFVVNNKKWGKYGV